MLLIPAIDLKDGRCVRLRQGDMDQSTVFGEDPSEVAKNWLEQGARRLHLVDLNGAFAGQPKNEMAIRKILKIVGSAVDVQLGGGIRDLDTIERYLDAGLRYVIIGTAAVKILASCKTPAPHSAVTSLSASTLVMERSPPTAGASSPAMMWSTWVRSLKTMASSRSCTPI